MQGAGAPSPRNGAGEASLLRPGSANFGTFAASPPDSDGNASSGEFADDAAPPPLEEQANTEFEAEISLLEHGRSFAVSHKAFNRPARPTARQVERALSVQWPTEKHALSIPGIHTPIHPASLAVRAWTAYMLVLTCTYVAFLEPVFVAFNTNITTSRSTAVIDLVSGAAFAFDLLVNFRSGVYYVCDGHVKLVLDAQTIASEYVSRFFVVDLLAAVPFFVQVGYYIVVLATGAPPHTAGTAVTIMRALRLLRVVRLWKLFLSRRAMLGAEVWMMHKSGSPLVIFALSVIYWFAFLVNLMGCTFIFTATLEGLCDSWVTQLGVADNGALDPVAVLNALDGSTLCEASGLLLPPGGAIYVSAVYFATMTLTTVGYGDVVAKTDPEKLMVVAFMLIGAFFIATFTGQMVRVLAKHGATYAQEQNFKDKMVAADTFVKENNLPPPVQSQVLSWVTTAYMPHERRSSSFSAELLAELPVSVRSAAVASITGERALRNAFLGASPSTFVWLAGRMQPRQLHTGHYLCLEGESARSVFFTTSGALAVLAPARQQRPGAPLGVLSGRGHCVGGALAAASLSGDAGGAPGQWRTCVQATVETGVFELPLEVFAAALLLGGASDEERQALRDSLARADDVHRLLQS